MGGTPHLKRRGAIYYFRMSVPKHLTHRLKRYEVKSSLHTSDRAKATLLCRALSNTFDTIFGELNMAETPFEL